jgi:hypothetical protein
MANAERRAIAVLLAVSALAFPSPIRGAGVPGETPHSHFRLAESCPRCHLPDRDGRPDPARFAPEADSLCTGCHRRESLGRTHPMEVLPDGRFGKVRVPPDLRLAAGGRMICLTCHAAHGAFRSSARAFPGQVPDGRAIAGAPRYRTFFLRRSSPERGAAPLCEACHGMPR